MAKHILVPVDLSEISLQAVDAAGDLALSMGADITLMHAVTEAPKRPSFAPGRGSRPPPATMMSGVQQEETQLKHLREERLPEVQNVILQLVSSEGDIAAEICAHAERMHMDLIVLTSHGRTGLSHALMGSVAEEVLKRAPCPVVVVGRKGR